MPESLLFKKIYGSIVEYAIGDAIGSAVETMHKNTQLYRLEGLESK